MAFFSADTKYTPGRVTTSADAGGVNLPPAPKGGSIQLAALLGPAFATRQKMAELQMQNMKRDMFYEQQARREALSQGTPVDRTPSRAAAPAMEASYVKQMGGPNTVPGMVRTYGGDPGAVFGGMWQVGSGPQGKTSFENTGGRDPRMQGFEEMSDPVAERRKQIQALMGAQDEQADWYGLGNR